MIQHDWLAAVSSGCGWLSEWLLLAGYPLVVFYWTVV